jgi:hypothetical protein
MLDLCPIQIVVIGNGILRELIRLKRIGGERLRRKRCCTGSCHRGRACGGHAECQL